MSTLPELTDEQIDAAWDAMHAVHAVHGSCVRGIDNRSSNRWTGLRAAFPAPPPPPPIFERDDYSVLPMRSSEWPVSVTADGVALTVDEAREFATAINACAEWIEANR